MAGDDPFVLIDDARPGGKAFLYRDPVAVHAAADVDGVAAVLDALEAERRAGRHVAGFLGYEAGAALVPGVPGRSPGTLPLAWFGVFAGRQAVDPARLLPDPAGAIAGPVMPTTDPDGYRAMFDRVAEWIRAGDVYQANLTIEARVPVRGAPAALYHAVRRRAGAGHGALVWTGADWLLSFSPELFFAVEGGRIEARPMKGTAPRRTDPLDDAAAAAGLAADPKQRAENLMIVDLMRNDLARVALAGSVAVPDRFVVETYPTVHQLVSRITATLAPGQGAVTALRALFPCGSITGAPKRRAMEVIHAVEGRPRGIYTGAIGAIAPSGDAAFSVAIRTLHWPDGAEVATLGLGSGIVADSDRDAEWDECLTKARFLDVPPPRFDLLETMAFDPQHGIALLEGHMARLRESASALGFAFDRHAARNELQAATFRLREASRVRMLLARSGATAITTSPLPPPPVAPVPVGVRPLPIDPRDWRRGHKIADRRFWPPPPAGCFETVFQLADGRLTEGSFTTVFVPRGDVLLTPPLAAGVLPGVLRAELIARGEAVEAELTVDDLAQGFYVGNAVRGLIRARPVADGDPRG